MYGTVLKVLLMLTTVEVVQSIPGLGNIAQVPIAWLNSLIGAADSAVKHWLKRDIELQAYEQFYDGNDHPDLTIKQRPVLDGSTTIAAGSNGQALPQATINVASTANFNPGTAGDPSAQAPSIAIQVSTTTWTRVTYTGTTATTFTGCSGGTGTLTTANQVQAPVVFFDPGGYYGGPVNSFAAGTQLVRGVQFMPIIDSSNRTSKRGLLKKLGGPGQGFIGFYPEVMYSGKLGSYRKPCWPRGDGNIKVCYSAGYTPSKIPFEIGTATAMYVAQLIRIQPMGSPLNNESLGSYSYSVLANSDDPEIGSIRNMLAPHRETSW